MQRQDNPKFSLCNPDSPPSVLFFGGGGGGGGWGGGNETIYPHPQIEGESGQARGKGGGGVGPFLLQWRFH